MKTILFVIILHICINGYTQKQGCTVNLNKDVQEQLPLLLKTEPQNEFHLPEDRFGNVNIRSSETIKLACPKGKVVIQDKPTNDLILEAICIDRTNFQLNGQTVRISEIQCSRHPFHTARATGNKCLGHHKEIEIGFALPDHFIRIIDICFDQQLQITLYSHFQLSSTIGGYQAQYPRPNFLADRFHKLKNVKLEKLFKRNIQRSTINSLLGLPVNSTKYIQNFNNYYLSRGHLTAKADFVYGSVQRSTFHMVNIAPQWQTLNSKNWATLELNLRDFASSSRLDLDVFTGTAGVATLPHETTKEDVELYLYNNVNDGKKAIPVPHLFWKVAYDPSRQLGVGFVGLNNPYSDELEKICPDVCSTIKWIKFNNSSPSDLGFVYCCDVRSLREKILNIPPFPVKDLLV